MQDKQGWLALWATSENAFSVMYSSEEPPTAELVFLVCFLSEYLQDATFLIIHV